MQQETASANYPTQPPSHQLQQITRQLAEQKLEEGKKMSSVLQQLQSQTSVNSHSSQQSFQQEGFQVIGKSAQSQALVVKLQPDNVLWHKGIPLFSSQQIKQKLQLEDIAKNFIEGVGWWQTSPKTLANLGKQMSYYILSKQQPLNGKILILSHNIYKQNFYINFNHLLTINYDSSQYNLKKHSDLKYLKLVQASSTSIPLFITLQSTKGSAIVQKYLAPEEGLYLPNATILAMSENIRYKWQPKHRLFKLSGPGYVFFQPKSQLLNTFVTTRNRDMIILNILLIVMIVILYLIEYFYLK